MRGDISHLNSLSTRTSPKLYRACMHGTDKVPLDRRRLRMNRCDSSFYVRGLAMRGFTLQVRLTRW